MNRLQLLGRSILHTPSSQLAARGRLMTRRRWTDATTRLRSGHRESTISPPLALRLPEPLFRQSSDHCLEDGALLNLVGTEVAFREPMLWKPRYLERGSLEMLTLHYTEFIENAVRPEQLMLDWLASNPSRESGAWRDAWNSYAISIRTVAWMQQIAMRPGSFSPNGLNEIRGSIAAQVRYLIRNLEVDIRGNHLVKNLRCLMWAGRFFAGSEAESWFTKGTGLLAETISEQILSDGMHFERSASYHNQVLADLADCYSLMDDSALRTTLGNTLDSMAQVSVDLTHPDGYPSMMNDGGFTMAPSSAEIQAALSVLGRRPLRQNTIIDLPHAGYFGIRTGQNLLLVDCGPIGPNPLPAHAHGDILSFEWSINGERVIVDAGVHEYRAGPRRDYARSTMAHNTVAIEGKDQAEFWSSFRVGRRPLVEVDTLEIDPNSLLLSGSHNGYSRLPGSPTHHRTLEATDSQIDITDRVVGGRGQRVTAGILVAPSFDVVREHDGLMIRGTRLCLKVTSDAVLSVEEAQYSTNIGSSERTQRIRLDLGSAPTARHFSLSVVPNNA